MENTSVQESIVYTKGTTVSTRVLKPASLLRRIVEDQYQQECISMPPKFCEHSHTLKFQYEKLCRTC